MTEKRNKLRRKEDVEVHNTAEKQSAVISAVGLLGALVLVLLVVVTVLSVAAFKRAGDVQDNGEQIAKLQRSDTKVTRQLNFASCQRANITRAEIQDTLSEAIGPDALRVRERRIPIQNCAPILHGLSSEALSVVKQREFVAYFVRCEKVPPSNINGKITYPKKCA